MAQCTPKSFDLTGKVALITGASYGIGMAIAKAMAANGATIVFNDIKQELVDKGLASYAEAGIKAHGYVCDVTDEDAVNAMVAKITEEVGHINILVNNAGLASGFEHIDEGDPMDWDKMIDTNVKGLLYVTRIITPKMIAAGGGHVINIGSIAGTEPYENGAVYCASKHAVHAISQAMRADLLSHRIKVTEIRPGMVETEFSLVRFHGDQERADKTYTGVEPLTGADIAETIAWIVQLPAHMNVNDIVLMPAQQAGAYYTCRNTK